MQETTGAVNTLFFSPDNRYLVYGTQGNELVLYDLPANKAGQNLLNTGRGVTAAAWSPTEDLLAWGIYEDYPLFDRRSFCVALLICQTIDMKRIV